MQINEEDFSGEKGSIENTFDVDNYDKIDHFYFLYGDSIYDIYTDLKQRFSFISPNFLCLMYYHHLVDFYTDLYFLEYKNDIIKSDIENFIQDYKTELDISYNIASNFLKKKINITFKTWVIFCNQLSNSN